MSDKDIAKSLIEQTPNETPNSDTIEAMQELEGGGGHGFSGTTERLFDELIV
jgi:hypothetical protein